ncbi:hypothetical protein AB0M11_19685 [Streptomyces sp. NPDC051987]|uniref:hypothetical protein n=1 Tax=Streptomyces sp. NPDC051987 TaxID=3155808 RepID=UPI00342ACDB1
MATHLTDGDTRLSLWRRVREFAVPPAMIETATARRTVGDWAGACAAAGFDVDLDLRALARARGRDVTERVRADLRLLAPDLLRWHLPRIAPDGLLRPGLTMPLARYDAGDGSLCLVVRTPPAWADAGQRISLALWDGTLSEPAARGHPHPHPSRRFRFDLHRHLWNADAAGDLRTRAGTDRPPSREPAEDTGRVPGGDLLQGGDHLLGDAPFPGGGPHSVRGPSAGGGRFAFTDGFAYTERLALHGEGPCATDRWADEARIVLDAEGRDSGTVVVRLSGRRRLALCLAADGTMSVGPDAGTGALPVLPDAATWTLPDLELLRAGLVDAGRLHPLVAAALVPRPVAAGRARAPLADPARRPDLVECRGARHRIGLVDGVLSPLDHSPDELRREDLLVALGGPPLPCLRAIDEAHRRPDCLTGVRERLDHGDVAGALAVVEGLLGPEAVLRDGPLKDALESAAERRITYGLYRAGLVGSSTGPVRTRRRRSARDPRLGPRAADRR